MFHILELATPGTVLTLREGGIYVEKKDEEPSIFSADDFEVVLISHPGVVFSGYVQAFLAENQIPVVFCNRQMIPCGILLSCTGESAEISRMLERQLSVTSAFNRRFWQKLIRCKIAGQAAVLQQWSGTQILFPYIVRVNRGDSSCVEAAAAAAYWKMLNLFPRRDRNSNDSNILFNYMYMILYAILAREITVAGLLPRLGVHHHHRNDPFPLASDLMEPFRPCMDILILDFLKNQKWNGKLDTSAKNELLKRLYAYRLCCDEEKVTLFTACRLLVQSYKKSLLSKNIDLLRMPYWEVTSSDVAFCSI